jgi:catechol 2,3-dioxygenase-like lactoylglutathione lyase family enzyme
MIDHLGFAVSDIERSRRFYDAALAPLGVEVLMTVTPDQHPKGGTVLGYGRDGHPFFWIGDKEQVGEGTHIAFAATREQVDAFYAAAIAAGGRDNGPPGIREHYHPNYYAAFVFDPDGINVEAVSHSPE